MGERTATIGTKTCWMTSHCELRRFVGEASLSELRGERLAERILEARGSDFSRRKTSKWNLPFVGELGRGRDEGIAEALMRRGMAKMPEFFTISESKMCATLACKSPCYGGDSCSSKLSKRVKAGLVLGVCPASLTLVNTSVPSTLQKPIRFASGNRMHRERV